MPENVEVNANRIISGLMVAAVLWIYSTVTDMQSRVVKLEADYKHTVEALSRHDRRISGLESYR